MAMDKTTMKSWLEAQGVTITPSVTQDQITAAYDQHAHKFDKFFCSSGMTYNGVDVLTQTMTRLFPRSRESVTVLDIGAGTGKVGEVLKAAGFRQLDALEASLNMMRLAEGKAIYRNLYNIVVSDQPLNLPSAPYDAVVMLGTVAHGSLPSAAFQHIVKLVKPGGYIVNCMREAFLHEIPDYKENWEPLVTRLEREGIWKQLSMAPYQGHFMDCDGVIMVFQIC